MRRCFEFSVIKIKATQENLEQDSAIAEIVGVPASWFWCCALGSNTGHGPYLRLFKGNRYNTIKNVWVLELRFPRFYKKDHWGNRKTGVYGTTSIQHGVRDWGADAKRPCPSQRQNKSCNEKILSVKGTTFEPTQNSDFRTIATLQEKLTNQKWIVYWTWPSKLLKTPNFMESLTKKSTERCWKIATTDVVVSNEFAANFEYNTNGECSLHIPELIGHKIRVFA